MSTKEQRIGEIVAGHAGREGPLLPILHDVQAELGCVDAESEALIPAAEKAAGDRVKLTTVYCLGLCSAGPAARTGDRLHARLDGKGLARAIEAAR